jgi:hypothetical protein
VSQWSDEAASSSMTQIDTFATQIAIYGIVLGTVAFAACHSHPQAPTPLGPSRATPSPSAQPAPGLPGTNPGNLPLVGLYTLTLHIGSGCALVPEAERTRKYTATIDYAGRGRYVVTLSDGTFLTGPICTAGSRHFSGIGCGQFFASEDIDTVQFFLENNNDEAHGGHIVEQLASGTWLEIIGYAGGKLDDPSSMEASGTSSVSYCRTPSSYPFPCSFVSCGSTDMRLTLTRKH